MSLFPSIHSRNNPMTVVPALSWSSEDKKDQALRKRCMLETANKLG